ncbi:MAG TPA: FAD-dependent monooxygenase [Vicinamibacteria bacterium]|nr:FAD-dependent monooxygenase [Vicinamibacteria bacterium]
MKINILGGGPAGLFLSILMKEANHGDEITVIERDGPNDTFGWGIVFSAETFDFLEDVQPAILSDIKSASETWDNVVVGYRDETILVSGNRFSGIARLTFLNILHEHCRRLGVELKFHTNVETPERIAELADCDLLVGADGANSTVRQTYAEFFCPSVDLRRNRYIWLGTNKVFDGLNMLFRENEAGLFIAHAYRFSKTTSTFIVECPPETWWRAGFSTMSDDETCAYLAAVWRKELDGQPLRSNNFVRWLNFPLIQNKRWSHRNIVLLGDALHTAHFSIGSGTKLALEDAIALAPLFREHRRVEDALSHFQRVRQPVVEKFQAAAYNSLTWLEKVEAEMALPAVPFAYRLMTRSQRVSYRRIQQGDPGFVRRYDRWRDEQPPVGAIPAGFMDLFQKKSIGHLASLMSDGKPHVTSVWVDYDGEYLLINSAKGRQKDLNMEKRRHVAVEIDDPDNVNRFLSVRGEVVDVVERGADEHLDKLALRYLNRDRYPQSMRYPGEVRRVYKIRLDHVFVWDPFGS